MSGPTLHRVSGRFKKWLSKEIPLPGAAPRPTYDAGAAEAAYERLVAAALMLRNLDAELARAAQDVAEREERLRASVAEYDRIAQAAIAGGRDIQAESAIASSEAAEATLAALAPRAGEIAALRAEAAAAAARIESDANALRMRIDTGSPTGDQTRVVSAAEDDAVRLTSLSRSLSP